MHYSDETRRFNFLGGLAFGAILGVGLALILKPQQRGRDTHRLRRTGVRLSSALRDAAETGREFVGR